MARQEAHEADEEGRFPRKGQGDVPHPAASPWRSKPGCAMSCPDQRPGQTTGQTKPQEPAAARINPLAAIVHPLPFLGHPLGSASRQAPSNRNPAAANNASTTVNNAASTEFGHPASRAPEMVLFPWVQECLKKVEGKPRWECPPFLEPNQMFKRNYRQVSIIRRSEP